MTALLGVLLFFNRQMAGAFDLYLFWLLPLPVIVYVLKFGISQSFVLAASMTLLSFIIASPITLFYVVGSIVAGLIYGYGMTRKWSSVRLIVSVVIVSLIMMILSVFVLANLFGYNIASEIVWYRETMMSVLSEMASGNSTVIDAMSSLLKDNVLFTMIVFSNVLVSIMEGLLVHLLSYALLKKLRMETPPMKPLSEIVAPKWLKITVFTVLTALLLSRITGVSQYDDIIMIAVVIVYAICMLYGYLLIVTFVTWKSPKQSKRLLMLLLAVFVALLLPPVMYIVGLLDIYTNTRQNIVKEIRKNGISD